MKLIKGMIIFLAVFFIYSNSAKAEYCEYAVVNANGRTIAQVTGGTRFTSKFEACREAQFKCFNELNYIQRMGRGPRYGLRCEPVYNRGGGWGYPQYETRTCTYRFDRRGPARQDLYFTASATGFIGTNAYQRACSVAYRQCLAYDAIYNGQCILMRERPRRGREY